VELRQLQYFIKVARKEHVTQAAEELHVAQSAVSRQIHQLEEELGVHLFVQKGRNLHLTTAGRLFLQRVEAIFADLEKAIQETQELLDPEAGEIRIGFPHSLGISMIPSVVAEFRKENPNVRFRLKQGTYNQLLKDIMEGEVDIAFISPFPEGHELLNGVVLLEEEVFAILPPGHPLAEHEEIRMEQLKDDSFVMLSEQYSLRSIIVNACLKAGFTPKIGFEGEETDTIRGLVAAGLGVSLLPEMALVEVSPLMPVKVRVMEPRVIRSIALIQRKGEKLPLVTEKFYCFLRKHFGQEIT
jgi:LysR family transcriptional regulator, transcription activator of glutamate synthase operon